MGTNTRYLSLLIRFKSLSSPLMPARPAENGCKSTTFFQTGKIFFHFPPKVFYNSLVFNMHCCKKFSPWGLRGGEIRGIQEAIPPFFGRNRRPLQKKQGKNSATDWLCVLNDGKRVPGWGLATTQATPRHPLGIP